MPGLPASSKQSGTCFGFPDVCLTPASPSPVPIPYPNTAELSSADGTVDKVMIENKETVVEDSKIPSSSGDEAGSLGGVVSGLNRGEVHFTTYSSKVYADGKKMVAHAALTTHNGSSANLPAGAQVAPSQAKVFVAP